MFARTSRKDEFIEQAKAARQERERERLQEEAALKIQSLFRRYLVRKKIVDEFLKEIDELIELVDTRGALERQASIDKDAKKTEPTMQQKPPQPLLPAVDAFQIIRRFLFVFNKDRDKHRFDGICRYLIKSIFPQKCDENDIEKTCYLVVAFHPKHAVAWIQQLKTILVQCSWYLKHVKPELSPNESKSLSLYLNILVTLTAPNSWPLLQREKFSKLRPVAQQLGANVIHALVAKGLYPNLQILLMKTLLRSRPTLTHATLSGVVSIALRPLIVDQFTTSLMNLFMLHILSVPAFAFHLEKIAPDAHSVLQSHAILKKSISVLAVEQNSRLLFNAIEANSALCLMANIVHLACIEKNSDTLSENVMDLVDVITKLMECCQKCVVGKQSHMTHWHPILGWFSQPLDQGLHGSMEIVKVQLRYLWHGRMVTFLFSQLLQVNSEANEDNISGHSKPKEGGERRKSSLSATFQAFTQSSNHSSAASSPTSTNSPVSVFLRKTIDKVNKLNLSLNSNQDTSTSSPASGSITSVLQSASYKKLGTPEATNIALICNMYEIALQTLSEIRLDILTGLSYQDFLLPTLWKFISNLGPANGLKVFLGYLALHSKSSAPQFQILIMFCDCASHLISILDDVELYTQEKPFTLEQLCEISIFLNHFLFRVIWNQFIDLKTINANKLFLSTHNLLSILYRRDSRRSYTPHDHWLIKDLKVSSFMKDYDNGKLVTRVLLAKLPHIIPHKERVILFRKQVQNEKSVLGLTESACAPLQAQSTLITVHRSRIVEDGYQQLALLPAAALKGVIRVKFINEQGLDEAGIDQDGVFKEFLEETIKRVFDPSLSLFKITSEGRLYPSPTSYIQENYIPLFEFIGKMLGKAVYEGYVVDVPFAHFFLTQVLTHGLQNQSSSLYSAIDELPSLDAELYKNLAYVKHFDGDVGDLGLTFSVDEECMGQIITHELIPGGKAISVTNDNRIAYIHHMAHFRMVKQIRDQTNAFIKGFRTVVNPEWLTMFSTPEFQRLISGDNRPIDLADLRAHTKYFGGFHNNHRVINWLWDILAKDFTPEEHQKFLKFVTSCSKPPLLGFAHLEPPFSIRCVEVSDDQDTGDTVGSVLRGFLQISRRDPVNRLPTSSTCFNLLKLPNYQKKSTLREKLRYAINSNTGFELS